jgi:hypothetical protein
MNLGLITNLQAEENSEGPKRRRQILWDRESHQKVERTCSSNGGDQKHTNKTGVVLGSLKRGNLVGIMAKPINGGLRN